MSHNNNTLMPPHSLEAEQAVIGSCLIDPDAIIDVLNTGLTSTSFYSAQFQEIFTALTTLFNTDKPIDLLTVTESLNNKQGTDVLLISAVNSVPTSINAAHYANLVIAYSQRRQIIRLASQVASSAYTEDISITEISGQLLASLDKINNLNNKTGLKSYTQHITEYRQRQARKMASQQDTIIPTGFPQLDKMLDGGLHKDELTVIAGRPGMGKSALAEQITYNAARFSNQQLNHKAVAIFSLEMSVDQIIQRSLSARARLPIPAVRRPWTMTQDQYDYQEQRLDHFANLPIYLDDSTSIDVAHVRTQCFRVMNETGLALVLVDYLQLMQGNGQTRQQEIGSMTRGLKNLAKELNIPIVILAQLNRSVENRHDKRPILNDLRESGDIEQDANNVLFLYREDYYIPDCIPTNILETIIAKQRNGPTGTVELYWHTSPNKNGLFPLISANPPEIHLNTHAG